MKSGPNQTPNQTNSTDEHIPGDEGPADAAHHHGVDGGAVAVDLVEEADGDLVAVVVHARHVAVDEVGVLQGLHHVVAHELAQHVLKLGLLHLLHVVNLEVDLLELVDERWNYRKTVR